MLTHLGLSSKQCYAMLFLGIVVGSSAVIAWLVWYEHTTPGVVPFALDYHYLAVVSMLPFAQVGGIVGSHLGAWLRVQRHGHPSLPLLCALVGAALALGLYWHIPW